MKRYIMIISFVFFFTGAAHYTQAGGRRLTLDVVPDFSTMSWVDIDGSGGPPAPANFPSAGEPFLIEGRIDKKNTTTMIGTYLCRGWFVVPQADGEATYVSQSFEIEGKGTIFVQGFEGAGANRAIVGATGSFQGFGQAKILPHPTSTNPIAFRIVFHFNRGRDRAPMIDPMEENSESQGQQSEQNVAPVELQQNHPNPFNPETEISFTLPKTSVVVVKIYNSLGQEVRTLTDGQYEAGTHTLRWDGLNNQGSAVASGVYLQRLEVDGVSVVKKMNLVR